MAGADEPYAGIAPCLFTWWKKKAWAGGIAISWHKHHSKRIGMGIGIGIGMGMGIGIGIGIGIGMVIGMVIDMGIGHMA